jgi:hypothetical protein
VVGSAEAQAEKANISTINRYPGVEIMISPEKPAGRITQSGGYVRRGPLRYNK